MFSLRVFSFQLETDWSVKKENVNTRIFQMKTRIWHLPHLGWIAACMTKWKQRAVISVIACDIVTSELLCVKSWRLNCIDGLTWQKMVCITKLKYKESLNLTLHMTFWQLNCMKLNSWRWAVLPYVWLGAEQHCCFNFKWRSSWVTRGSDCSLNRD